MMIFEVVAGIVVFLLILACGFSVRIVREYRAHRPVPARPGRGAQGPRPRADQPGHRSDRVGRSARALSGDPRTDVHHTDNAPISIDFMIFWKVVDPSLTVLQVANFAAAAQGIATTLRTVVGDLLSTTCSPSARR